MIKYITYLDKKYPIRISYRAINAAQNETDDDKVMETMLFYSMVSGEKKINRERSLGEIKQSLKKLDMEDVLDECFVEFMKLVPLFTKELGELMPDQVLGNLTQQPKPKGS